MAKFHHSFESYETLTIILSYVIDNILLLYHIILLYYILNYHNKSKLILIVFQGRAVDMKTLTLIEEPSEENLAEAEDEFERLLNEGS